MRSALLKSLWSMAFPFMAGFRAYRSFIRNKKTYLHVTGWWEGARRDYPCSAQGEQLPWMNYVVIVDGRDRVSCLKQCLEHLADDGGVVLDDSDKDIYREGTAYVQARGFRALVFEGLIPTRASRGRTTVLYRRENCLGL